MTDALLTTGQVAARLGIDRRTVWSRVKAGMLSPAMELPNRRGYLFDRAEIEALAEEAKQ
ncbi:TPA: helix-turn-helix transcriptional regulator [Corynebacterium striatum]|nr:helix-turn-helix domain-containing protein [Corynebacterium striatum]HAT6563668.1 helix-turn-helix domain-containing protein [Corynebacterium striatum]HAT6569020.1 helix-turn-helix domain-containing protein [Corynebacterium striatum]HCG2976153.1 helix-turn-helix domain-containing protein [Corynebacterium striatum]HDV6349131.1 helix-turn-helix domain-containing protein [Corynebacterium striatum]